MQILCTCGDHEGMQRCPNFLLSVQACGDALLFSKEFNRDMKIAIGVILAGEMSCYRNAMVHEGFQ